MSSNSFEARSLSSQCLLLLPLVFVLSACVNTEFTRPIADVATTFAASAPGRSATGPWRQSFRDSRLDSLVASGLARNLSIEEVIAAISEAEAGVGLARAGSLPAASADASAVIGDTQGTDPITKTTAITLSTSWMLNVFGANQASRSAALAELEAAKLSTDAARQAVTVAIANAYVDLRYYQESIALTRQSIASRRETLSLTRSMMDAGQANRLDVLQSEQAVTQAEADLQLLEIGFDQAVNRLATLTAVRTADLRSGLLRGASQPTVRLKPSVGMPADVIRLRPDVGIAEYRLAAAVARVGVAEAAF